jgi:hypothetical protein
MLGSSLQPACGGIAKPCWLARTLKLDRAACWRQPVVRTSATTYHVVIDSTMIINAPNRCSQLRDLLSLKLAGFVLALGGLRPSIVILALASGLRPLIHRL